MYIFIYFYKTLYLAPTNKQIYNKNKKKQGDDFIGENCIYTSRIVQNTH